MNLADVDVIDWLPEAAKLKLSHLRTLYDDAAAARNALNERRAIEREKVQDANAEIRRRRPEYGLATERQAGHEDPAVVRLKEQVETAKQAFGRLEQPFRERAERANEAGRLVQSCESWVKERCGKSFVLFSGAVSGLKKNETAYDAVIRIRNELNGLREHQKKVTLAPLPSSEAKRIVTDYVYALADRGAPSIFSLIERGVRESVGEVVKWPTRSLKSVGDGAGLDTRLTALFLSADDAIAALAWV